jgi:hypothetical protein
LGLEVLKTPYRSPQANAFCERWIGTARRECLDFMIPLNESHVRDILKQGLLITIGHARTPVSDREFPTQTFRSRKSKPTGIAFRRTIVLL